MTKYQKNKLKKLLSEACLARDKNRCLKCGGVKTLCASHIYPKGTHRKMEFDLDNVITLCYRHHIHWWHKHPIEAAEWIKITIPKARYERLKLRSQVIDKTPLDYNLIKLDLENERNKFS